MKKKQITFNKKLSLDRDTIAKLDNEQIGQIYGGMLLNSCHCGDAKTATCIGGTANEEMESSCAACSCC